MTTITTDSVRTYLEQRASEEPTCLEANDIAADLETSPKALVQYLHRGESNA